MKIRSTRERLLATTIICGVAMAAAAAAPAYAQNTTAPPPANGPADPAQTGQTGPATAPVEGAPSATSASNGQDTSTTGTVVVTGSRIPQPNLTSISPVTVVGSQEVKLEGTTRVEDLINNLPQAFADQGGEVSNGSSGTATVNLRNLGCARTLVLVDGKRLLPGNPSGTGLSASCSDLNNIPAALIDRVEVLTGGASSTYGSDAVAGVVNFIMQKNFQGVRIDAQASFYTHENNADDSVINAINARNFPYPKGTKSGGEAYDVTAVLGVNSPDGKGNATVYAGYRSIQPILQSERDYSACTLAESGSTFSCSGSGTTSPARFSTNGAAPLIILPTDPRFAQFQAGTLGVPGTFTTCPATAPTGGFVSPCSNGTAGDIIIPSRQVTIDPANPNNFRPYVSARDAFNFGPYNYFQRPDTRYTAGAFAHYQVSNALDAYTQLMFMDDHTVAQIAPSGIFGQVLNLPCNNPLLSAQQEQQLCTTYGLAPTDTTTISVGKRNQEGGGRQDDRRHTSYRLVLGVRGDVAPGFSYDASLQYGTTIYSETYFNDFSLVRSQRALDVVTGPNGAPTCRSVINGTDPNCIPYNIFKIGGVTQAALNYVSVPGFQRGETTEQVAQVNVSGLLGEYGIKSPFANDGVGVAVGAEYRREALSNRTDLEFTTGDLAGQGGPTIGQSGSFDVYELYGETRIPLVQGLPFADLLQVEAGYRFSDYSSAGNTNAYKFGGDYAPIHDIRFRASYNRAVRAPNIAELFSAQAVGLFNGKDPCAGTAPTATAAQCAATGVSAAQYGSIVDNPAGQFNALAGGNPGLAPEVSDTYSAGIVLQPRFLGDWFSPLTVSVDYYKINVKGTIGTIGAALTIDQCIKTGSPFFCNLIHRAPGNGSLFLGTNGFVIDTNLNTGSLSTSGIDIEANYRLPLSRIGLGSFGSVSFNYVANYLDKYVIEPVPGLGKYDCAGLYGLGCGAGAPSTPIFPQYRHRLRAGWTTPWNVQLSGQWRYIASVDVDATSSNALVNGSSANAAVDNHIPAQNYFDLSASYRFHDRYTFRLGVNNIFDKDPPYLGSGVQGAPFGNGNTFPQIYDALGRYIFMGVSADF